MAMLKGNVFAINGGKPLAGTIAVAGSKNAAVPILSAALLSAEPSTITNVPRIEDVERMVELMRLVGAEVTWDDEHTLTVSAPTLNADHFDGAIVRQLRASVLLWGSLLGRTGKLNTVAPGGDQIGARPLDAHLEVLSQLGVTIDGDAQGYALRYRADSTPREITLYELSVTATENALLVAALRPGLTSISNAAAEPHVQDLCHFLVTLGAEISGIGTHELRVRGREVLHGARHTLIPDLTETSTFIALAAATRSTLTLTHTAPQYLKSELAIFRRMGVPITIAPMERRGAHALASLTVGVPPTGMKSVDKIHEMPYPGISSDTLPLFAVLATQAQGATLIHGWMYEGRQKYLHELAKMGANVTICDPHRALIIGPTPLYGLAIESFDIRAGAVLVIAACAATGRSTIANAYQIDRGYEALDERLKTIGIDITRQQVV